MNLFKGLLYLLDTDPPAPPRLIRAQHYGAASAGAQFGGEFGNHAASVRRFGVKQDAAEPCLDDCVAAGCL